MWITRFSSIKILNNNNFLEEYLTNYTKDANKNLKFFRGLWAMCAYTCQWFWEENYLLQQILFTPTSKDFFYFLVKFYVFNISSNQGQIQMGGQKEPWSSPLFGNYKKKLSKSIAKSKLIKNLNLKNVS